jgi:hypothetical protein
MGQFIPFGGNSGIHLQSDFRLHIFFISMPRDQVGSRRQRSGGLSRSDPRDSQLRLLAKLQDKKASIYQQLCMAAVSADEASVRKLLEQIDVLHNVSSKGEAH